MGFWQRLSSSARALDKVVLVVGIQAGEEDLEQLLHVPGIPCHAMVEDIFPGCTKLILKLIHGEIFGHKRLTPGIARFGRLVLDKRGPVPWRLGCFVLVGPGLLWRSARR